jgi:hypothetical protein
MKVSFEIQCDHPPTIAAIVTALNLINREDRDEITPESLGNLFRALYAGAFGYDWRSGSAEEQAALVAVIVQINDLRALFVQAADDPDREAWV